MVRDEGANKRNNTDFEYATRKIPAMSTRIQVTKIPRMDTSQFADWDWRDGNKRNSFHIKVARPKVKQV